MIGLALLATGLTVNSGFFMADLPHIILVAPFVLLMKISEEIERNASLPYLAVLLADDDMTPFPFLVHLRIITSLKSQRLRTGPPPQAGVKHQLGHGQNIQDLMGSHEVVRVGARQSWNHLPLIALQEVQPLF